MKPQRLITLASRSIVRNKMRTFLTTLGIIIGVGAVIVMVAIGQGARSQIQQRIQNLGTNLLVITPGATQTGTGAANQGAGSFNRITVADADALKRESTLLAGVSPVILAPSQVIGPSGNWRTAVQGGSVDLQSIRNWTVESGRFFDDDDVRSMRKVCLLGHTVAQALFPDQDPTGQQIRIRNVPFDIIGVLATKGQTADGNDQDDVILAPYTTVQTRLAGRQFIPQIIASTQSQGDIPAAQLEIRDIMRQSHNLVGNEQDDFTIRNQNDIAATASATTTVMTWLLASIASISLLVGGIGIMNIMLVSVTERTREIGVRMAVGARGSDVLAQFLVEALVLCTAGGVIGVLLGFLGTIVVHRATGWGTQVNPLMVGVAIGFAALVGIFFGYYPARKAAALDPIEALRYE